tara:strand:+ start:200 stop:406 length:207 start_codon:yes stop_codon:yes gene_type:complete
MKISNYILHQSLDKGISRLGKAILFGVIIKEYKKHNVSLDKVADVMLSITDIHSLRQMVDDYKDIELA